MSSDTHDRLCAFSCVLKEMIMFLLILASPALIAMAFMLWISRGGKRGNGNWSDIT